MIIFAQIYLVVITILCLVALYIVGSDAKVMKKNKSRYNLLNLRFEVTYYEEGFYVLDIVYDGDTLASIKVDELEFESRADVPFRILIKWLEEDYKG